MIIRQSATTQQGGLHAGHARLETTHGGQDLPNEKGAPTGKLADAEVHFTDGEMEGLRLLGFAVWERRNGPGRNVTFPARTYSVNGERRSFSLLRPVSDTQRAERRSATWCCRPTRNSKSQAAVAS